MASSYTGLGTELMTTGENAGDWGSKTNTNLQIIEQLAGGYIEKAVTSTPTTLAVSDGSTGSEFSHRVLKFTGTITGNQVVTIPLDVQQMYVLVNGTSGAYTVQFKYVSGSGSSLTFATTDKGTKIVYATADDGTNPNLVDSNIGGVGAYDLDGNELTLDADSDTSITASTDDQIDFEIAGADDFTMTANAFNVLTGSHATFADSANAKFGTGNDMLVYHDGSNSYITNATGALKLATETSGIAITIGHTTSETTIADNLTTTGNTSVGGTLGVTGVATFATHVALGDSDILKLGAGTDLTLYHDGSNSYITNAVGALKIATETSGIAVTIGHSTSEVTIADNLTVTGTLTLGSNAELTEAELELLDRLTAGTAIASKVVTTDASIDTTGQRNLTISGELDAATLDISSSIDIAGASQFSGAITVGVDDTGLDVKLFGAAAGAYGLYDQSENAFEVRGATAAGAGLLKLTTGELTVVDADKLGRIDFQAPLESDGTDAVAIAASIWAEADDTFSATVNNTDLVFALGKSEAAAEKFRLTADGEIGLGGANYGTDGQVLTSAGAGAAVAWEDVTGSVTAINNATANELVTIGSTTTELDAEANLTFTGSALTCIGTITVGVDNTGHDVKYFGATSGSYWLWDESADGVVQIGTLTVGVDDAGHDVKFFGNAASAFMLWDASTDDLVLGGAAKLYLYDAAGGEHISSDGSTLSIAGGGEIDLTATAIDINGTCDVSGTLTNGSAAVKVVGTETIWVPANAMTPTTSNPCADITAVETTSGRPDMYVLDFDKDSDEFAQFTVAFPKSWNAGTVTYQVFWSGLAATGGVSWSVDAVAFANNDSIDTAYGTAVVVDDTEQGAVEELNVSAVSGAVTIAGTPADDDLTYFRIFRDVSDSNDDSGGDARLHGIKLYFTTDAKNDA